MQQERKTVTAGPHILEFNIEDIYNIFFTSDLHFNHKNIINYSNRPYKDVEEMNISLINNINNKLDKVNNPILINCGDVVFSNVSKYDELMSMIHANKIYNIIGNHDLKNVLQRRKILPYNENEKVYWSTELIVIIYGKDKKKETVFTVSHYPHCNGQFMGAFNIHGHLHTPDIITDTNSYENRIMLKLRDAGLNYDVGVDGNNYKPVSLVDILTGNLNNYKLTVIDNEKWKNILGIQ